MANGDLKHAAQERIDAAVERGFPGQVLFFKNTQKQINFFCIYANTYTHTHTFLRNSVYENCIICTELLLISDLHEKVVPMYIPIIRSICYI